MNGRNGGPGPSRGLRLGRGVGGGNRARVAPAPTPVVAGGSKGKDPAPGEDAEEGIEEGGFVRIPVVPHTHVFVRQHVDGNEIWVPAKLLSVRGNEATVVLLSPPAPPRPIGRRGRRKVDPGPSTPSRSRTDDDAAAAHDDADCSTPRRRTVGGATKSDGEGEGDEDDLPAAALPSPIRSVKANDDRPSADNNTPSISDYPLGEGERMVTIDLGDYPSQALPLMDVTEHELDEGDGDGGGDGPCSWEINTRHDMCDLPYLHEAHILYNVKERYEHGGNELGGGNSEEEEGCHEEGKEGGAVADGEEGSRAVGGYCNPYTRSGDIVVSVNPYRWIKGLYAEGTRRLYAQKLVWRASPGARASIPPHLYEASSQAYRGLLVDGEDQSILVSGESGAGKTIAVKILMSHLATFESTRKDDGGESSNGRNGRNDGAGEEDDAEGEEGGGRTPPWRWGVVGWVVDRVHDLTSGRDDASASGDGDTDGDDDRYIGSFSDADDDPDYEPDELHQDMNVVVQRVLDSNPLLEAFGNAKTVRNDNSSRFGRYVQLQFRLENMGGSLPTCRVVGSRCETYLLERSRVVGHLGDERTFHVFYQLLAAPEWYKVERIWSGLADTDASSFKYVGVPPTEIIEGRTDARRWEKTLDALDVIGVRDEALSDLLRAICVVLQLGNLVFDVDPSNEEASFISSTTELDKLADLMGVGSGELSSCLTSRTVVAPNDEVYKVPLTKLAAKEVCDAFSKELYTKIFDWLVNAVNDATCGATNGGIRDDDGSVREAGDSSACGKLGTIGLLDIFGFETFDTNHFEQLCINHANERLQQKFTEDVFRSVRAEYEYEGIDLSEVHFEDNSDVLELLEGRLGLIDILNEECIRPGGSDAGFVNKVYANNNDRSAGSPLIRNRRYRRDQFGVRHYAGPVVYDATNFVVKNNETLPQDVVVCAMKSTNSIISSQFLLAPHTTKKKGNKGALVADTLWTKFRSQLKGLVYNLGKTRTWYVRCINPNRTKTAGVLDLPYTFQQLRYSGMISAVTISRECFPNRLSFRATFDRFYLLTSFGDLQLSSMDIEQAEDIRELIDWMLSSLLKKMEIATANGDVTKAFVCGKTKVYFRPGALEYLESELRSVYDQCAAKIQAYVRRNVAANNYKALRGTSTIHVRTVQEKRNHQVQLWVSSVFFLSMFMPLPLLMWRRFAPMPSWIPHRR